MDRLPNYTLYNEFQFLDHLGSYSDMGRRVGRKILLQRYLKALSLPSKRLKPSDIKKLKEYCEKLLKEQG
jgi:hypothetical protein